MAKAAGNSYSLDLKATAPAADSTLLRGRERHTIPSMLLYRLATEGFHAVLEPGTTELRVLYSDPFETPPARWEY
jgi:hypothetical protein